jgi:hypothetical protein
MGTNESRDNDVEGEAVRTSFKPTAVDVPPDATDEELDRLAEALVNELDRQAAEHHGEETETEGSRTE